MEQWQIWVCGGVGLALAAGLPSCTSLHSAAGTYIETRGPGVVLWAGRTLQLFDDKTFTYSYWSDDVGSGRYGSGTYRLAGNRLRLLFGPVLPAVAVATARPLAARPDTLLEFEVLAHAPTGLAPMRAITYATIAAHDAQGKIVAAVASDTAGRAVLRPLGSTRWLSVQSLGFVTWRQVCPSGSTAYRLVLPTNQGTPYATGTRMSLRLKVTTLMLKQGSARFLLEREAQ